MRNSASKSQAKEKLPIKKSSGLKKRAPQTKERRVKEKTPPINEKSYQTLFSYVPCSVLIIDKSGKILATNKQAEKCSGYPAKDLLERHISLIVKETYLVAFNALLKKCFKGTVVPTTEIEIINKQGKTTWMDFDLTPVRGHKRDALALVHLKDVTEKAALLQQLIQSERLKALGKMASGIAHNINNLLTIVLGHTRLIQSRPKDKQVLQDAINIILKSTGDGAQLVRKLQAFSRNEFNKEQFVPFDINYIIRESIEFIKPRWKHEAQFHNVRYNIKYNNMSDVVLVSGNPSELREVFVNIINNALDAMPKGGELLFSTKTYGSKALISIADSGIGIPKKLCKKVFDPFFTTKYGKGLGLGMSTAYGVITEHKGTISVKSIVGKGSEFTIKIPLTSKAVAREGKPAAAPVSGAKTANVLVIDDEKEICIIVTRILTGVGHTVFTSHTGKEGIWLFKNNHFDLVLTDLTMPEMSGLEVARTIYNLESKKKHKTPIVIFTGWGDTLKPSKLANTGVSMVISKPLDNDQLLNIVSHTVQFSEKKSSSKKGKQRGLSSLDDLRKQT